MEAPVSTDSRQHREAYQVHVTAPIAGILTASVKWVLLAGVHFRPRAAGVASDRAAPQELAVALPHARVLVGVVPAAAAHGGAAVGLLSRSVAQTPLRSRAVHHRIGFAVIGRLLDVDQLCVFGLVVQVGFPDLQKGGSLVASGPHWLHVNGLLVLFFQDVSQLAKLWECGPACLGGA